MHNRQKLAYLVKYMDILTLKLNRSIQEIEPKLVKQTRNATPAIPYNVMYTVLSMHNGQYDVTRAFTNIVITTYRNIIETSFFWCSVSLCLHS